MKIEVPLFHAYLFRYKEDPVLLIRNGPISSDAPYATDEQPGPEPSTILKKYKISLDTYHTFRFYSTKHKLLTSF